MNFLDKFRRKKKRSEDSALESSLDSRIGHGPLGEFDEPAVYSQGVDNISSEDRAFGEIVDDIMVESNGAVANTAADSGSHSDIVIEDPGSGMVLRFPVGTKIVTGEFAPITLSKRMSELVAVTDDGMVYISKSHTNDPHVMTVVERVSMSMPVRGKINVDLGTIQQIYEHCGSQDKSSKIRIRNTSRLQRELIGLLAQAASLNASDIHIIVNDSRAEARVRVDGVMRHMVYLQPQYAFELLAAAFALCDASDATYIPTAYQGARMSNLSTELPQSVQSVRMQFNPLANGGRYLIMRLLYLTEGKGTTLEKLGYIEKQIDQLETITARPVGINVISGPTGSGKSTTMKVLLERMIDARQGEINTITIEDPPEYVIRDAQQMPVTNVKTQSERGEAFTQAIAAGLRSDPDVMMIGEIRDKASADLAVEGALSGHPVYASLHANSAMDILSRLRDIGVEDFKVFDATVFSGLVGQRLVRRLCPHCRVSIESPRGAAMVPNLLMQRMQLMHAITDAIGAPRQEIFVAGTGCDNPGCSRGYTGRAVVAEIIIPDDEFMELMRESRKRDARRYWFTELEGLDLLTCGWFRVLRGEISPLDLENSVALIRPGQEHHMAMKRWWPHFLPDVELLDLSSPAELIPIGKPSEDGDPGEGGLDMDENTRSEKE